MSLLSWLGKTIGLTDHKFFAAYYGSRNSAGVPVTLDSALTVAAAWACIRLLSESTGIIPMALYRKTPNGREAITDHPVYGLIHERPNEDFTSEEIWEAVASNLASDGNGLLLPQKFNGRTAGLEFVHWRDCNVRVERRPESGALRYQFSFRGKAYDLAGRDVIHYRGFGLGRDVGLSPIRYGTNILGIAMAADDSAGRTFRNGSNTSGFIQTDRVLNKEQREQFNAALGDFRSLDDPGKMMLLEGGFKFEGTGINPDDLQLLMSRAFSVEQVCSLFRIPPFMIGHTEKASSYPNSLEQQILAFLTFALQPYLKRIEKRTKLALLTDAERAQGLYCEFNREALLQADSAAKASFLSTLAQNGFMTRDEGRDTLNLPRMGGNAGELTVQSAMVTLDSLGQAAETPASQAVRNALKAWLKDVDGNSGPANDTRQAAD